VHSIASWRPCYPFTNHTSLRKRHFDSTAQSDQETYAQMQVYCAMSGLRTSSAFFGCQPGIRSFDGGFGCRPLPVSQPRKSAANASAGFSFSFSSKTDRGTWVISIGLADSL
jgi:hypothetical protein